MYFADEDSPGCAGVHPLHTTGQIDVRGKGTIHFDLARNDECFPDWLHVSQPFAITGGSGLYLGAAGAGTRTHELEVNGSAAAGTDTWSGSLVVAGLDFVRKGVKRGRVKYRVSARDLVDGAIRATCQPGSGSYFRVRRRTVVKCSAMDSSANTVTGSFKVVVKRRR